MFRQRKSTIISVALIMMLLLGQTSVYAIGYNDTNNHWARNEIQKWSDKGLLQGSNGKFNPEQNINRAEMAVIIDRLMDYQEVGKNSYTDLNNNWYTDAVLKNIKAGVINGESDSIKPMEVISRQEAVFMLAVATGIKESKGKTNFLDDATISNTYKGYIKAFSENNYINGMPDGTFAPAAPLTRATVVKILDNMLAAWLTKAGTYTENYAGTVILNTQDVKLKNLTIEGNLIVAEGVADGEVYLDNVVVKGNMTVRGGGINSIYLEDTTVEKSLVVNKPDGRIRIVASGKTSIESTSLKSSAILTESKLKDNGFEEVLVTKDATKDSVIHLNGDFKDVEVASSTNLNIDGEIETLKLKSGSDDVEIDGDCEIDDLSIENTSSDVIVNKNIVIDNVDVSARKVEIECKGTIKELTTTKSADEFTLHGTGAVKDVTIKADDSNIDTKGTTIEVSSGVDGTKADGDAIKGGRTETNSGRPSTGDTSIVNKPSTRRSSDNDSTSTPPSDTEIVNSVKSTLSISGNLTSVTENISLLTSTNGVNISWVSSNPAIVSNTGLVNRPSYGQSNANVVLTATLTKGAVNVTKVFTIIVLAEDSANVGITYTIEETKAEPTTYQEYKIKFSGEANKNLVAFAKLTLGEETSATTLNATGVPMIDLKTLDHLFNWLNDDPEFNGLSGWDYQADTTDYTVRFTSENQGINVPLSFNMEYKIVPSQESVDLLIPTNKVINNTSAITIPVVPSNSIVYYDKSNIYNFDNSIKADSGSTSVNLSKFNEGDEIYAYMVSSDPAISMYRSHVKSVNKIVIDNTAPVITKTDGDEISVPFGTTIDPISKISCSDNLDSNPTISYEYYSFTESKIVDAMTKPGSYSINYEVTDWAGNSNTSVLMIKITKEYSDIVTYNPIEVALNTEQSTISLPVIFGIQLKDGSTMNIDITPSWTCDSYDASTPGDYTFSISGITLPDYIIPGAFDGNASVVVTVLPSTDISVSSVKYMEQNYNTGITKSDIVFPTEATIVLSNNAEVTVDLSSSTWTSAEFDGDVPNAYIFFTTMPDIPNVVNSSNMGISLTVNITSND